ncbi:MAG: hypothetical protein WBX25_13415 [Rhodomicrobium sp.]
MSRNPPSSLRGSPARVQSSPFAMIAKLCLLSVKVAAWALPMLPAVRINVDAAAGQGPAWLTFSIGSIAFSAICIEITISSAEGRHFLRAMLYGTLGVLFLALNISNAIGNAAAHSEGSREDRSSQIERKQRLEKTLATWSQARKAQFDLAGDATPKSIESEIQAAKAVDAKRWNATGGCDVARITAGPTRVFCEGIAKLEAKLAAARKRDELDAKIANLDKDRAAAPTSLDPFADNIARAIGMLGYAVDADGKVLIATARDWAKAAGVELLAAFGPAALLLMLLGAKRKHEISTVAAEKPARARRPTSANGVENEASKPAPAVIVALPGDTDEDSEMLGFITRKLERCEGAEMKATPLFNLWREDCSETGAACGTQKAFSARIKRYFEHDRNKGRPVYRNVRRRTAQTAIRMVVSN